MSVSLTVVALADLIEERLSIESARDRLQLQILRLMPLYVQIRDLVAWESAFTAVMNEADSPEGSTAWVLEHVFDFGRGNMYGVFEEATARTDYAFMQAELLRAGIPVPDSLELDEW